MRRSFSIFVLLLAVIAWGSTTCRAQDESPSLERKLLKGGIHKQEKLDDWELDEGNTQTPPNSDQEVGAQGEPQPSDVVSRSKPLKLDASKFDDRGRFDIGAEAGDKQLLLAWERWHKQFSAESYTRACARSNGTVSGFGCYDVMVYRNGTVGVRLVKSGGDPAVAAAGLDAIRSMNGNPGLTFPVASERQQVSFTKMFMVAPNIRPGYGWITNDYETVGQSY